MLCLDPEFMVSAIAVYASMGDPRAAILAEQMLEAVWPLFPRAVPAGLWLPLTLAQHKKTRQFAWGLTRCWIYATLNSSTNDRRKQNE
jgi:hypothetical protein